MALYLSSPTAQGDAQGRGVGVAVTAQLTPGEVVELIRFLNDSLRTFEGRERAEELIDELPAYDDGELWGTP